MTRAPAKGAAGRGAAGRRPVLVYDGDCGFCTSSVRFIERYVPARAEIVAWNNKERDLRLSDLPHELQEYMENYIQRYVPRNRVVYHWFDVYDLEEQRI